MKNKILALLIILISFITTVKAYTTSDVSNVVNNGAVTKEFIEAKKKQDCTVAIKGNAQSNNLNISYYFKCTEEKKKMVDNKEETYTEVVYDGTNSFDLVLNGDVLEVSKSHTEEDAKNDPYLKDVMSLVPFWGVEMSNKYNQVVKYIDKNHNKQVIETLKLIFDRCYYQEMGVCYTAIPGMVFTTYEGKIKLDDTAVDYALKFLKAEQRQLDSKNRMFMLGGVAIVLLILLLIAKSMAGNPAKKEKFVWSIENVNIKK